MSKFSQYPEITTAGRNDYLLIDKVPITSSSTNIITLNNLGISLGIPLTSIFNVRNYGALGDGATDDHVAFQNANNAASSAGGGIIFVPGGGNFKLNANIDLSSNVSLIGAGFGSLITLANNVAIRVMTKSNVSIKDIYIDANLHTVGNSAISIQNPDNIEVDHIWLYNAGGFGVFIYTDASATSYKARITRNRMTGKGNNDIIGGGPQSATSVLSEIIIENNFCTQDAAQGNHYQTAIDLVAQNRNIIRGNITHGDIRLGGEKIPHYHVDFSHNNVSPALSLDYCELAIHTNSDSGQTANSTYINVESNQIIQGAIIAQGQSATTSPTTKVIIAHNNIESSTTVTGDPEFTYAVSLNYMNNVSVVGNIMKGSARAVNYVNVNGLLIDDNILESCSASFVGSGSNSGINIMANPGATTISGDINAKLTVPGGVLATTSATGFESYADDNFFGTGRSNANSSYFDIGTLGDTTNVWLDARSTNNANVSVQLRAKGTGILNAISKLTTSASTTSRSGLNITSGVAPTSPNDGDVWFDGTNLKIRIAGVTKTFTVT